MEYIRTYNTNYNKLRVFEHNKKYYCQIISKRHPNEYYHVSEMNENTCTVSVVDKVSENMINLIKRF